MVMKNVNGVMSQLDGRWTMDDGEEEEGVAGYVLCSMSSSMLYLLCDVLKIDFLFFSPNVCARAKVSCTIYEKCNSPRSVYTAPY